MARSLQIYQSPTQLMKTFSERTIWPPESRLGRALVYGFPLAEFGGFQGPISVNLKFNAFESRLAEDQGKINFLLNFFKFWHFALTKEQKNSKFMSFLWQSALLCAQYLRLSRQTDSCVCTFSSFICPVKSFDMLCIISNKTINSLCFSLIYWFLFNPNPFYCVFPTAFPLIAIWFLLWLRENPLDQG